MVWLYVVVAVWLLLGLLLYLAIIFAFKCDVVVLSAILKDEDEVLEIVKLSKQYDEMFIIGKVAFFLYMLSVSPFLFVFLCLRVKEVVCDYE